MKKILVILVLSLLIAGTYGCQKPPLPTINDTPADSTGGGNGGGGVIKVSPYVGTWNYSKIDLKKGTLAVMGNDVGTFTGTGSKIVGEVIITEKPNKYTTTVAFTANVNAVLGGQTQAQTIPIDKQSSSGTWTEANGQITLTDDNGKVISIISSTSSKIVFTGSFTTQIPNQFFTIDAKSDIEFTITK